MVDLTGRHFGSLRVVGEEPSVRTPAGYKQRVWLCLCACGRTTPVRQSNLSSGATSSCGCKRMKHGGYGTRLYSIWRGMVQRCTVPGYAAYKNYGARGVDLCEEWREFGSFQAWAVVSGYTEDLTLERKNNDAGYSPNNCCWIPRDVQAKNRRTNVRVRFKGSEYIAADLAKKLGVRYTTLLYRHHRGKQLEN